MVFGVKISNQDLYNRNKILFFEKSLAFSLVMLGQTNMLSPISRNTIWIVAVELFYAYNLLEIMHKAL